MRPNEPELQHLLRNPVFEDQLQRNWERVWWNKTTKGTHFVTLQTVMKPSSSTHENGPEISEMDLRRVRHCQFGFLQSSHGWRSIVFHLFAWTYFVWCLQNWHFIFWIDFGLHLLPGPFWVLKQNPVTQKVEQILELPSNNCLFKRLNYHKMWQQERLVD